MTTTDNFTEAARAEADRRMREADFVTSGDMARAHGFTLGAERARDHLAAQEPTDAEVGAVQKRLHERTLTWVPTVEVRAALSAARAARRDEETR